MSQFIEDHGLTDSEADCLQTNGKLVVKLERSRPMVLTDVSSTRNYVITSSSGKVATGRGKGSNVDTEYGPTLHYTVGFVKTNNLKNTTLGQEPVSIIRNTKPGSSFKQPTLN